MIVTAAVVPIIRNRTLANRDLRLCLPHMAAGDVGIGKTDKR